MRAVQYRERSVPHLTKPSWNHSGKLSVASGRFARGTVLVERGSANATFCARPFRISTIPVPGRLTHGNKYGESPHSVRSEMFIEAALDNGLAPCGGADGYIRV